MLVFEERVKPEFPKKTSLSKVEIQQQTQATYDFDAGIWTQATLVGASALITAPFLLPTGDSKGGLDLPYISFLCKCNHNCC